MRILLVSDVSPVAVTGGGERVVREEGVRLAARGHHVRAVSRAPDDAAPPTVQHEGLLVYHVRADRRSPLAFFRTAIVDAGRAVTRHVDGAVDVVNVYQPLAGYGALGAASLRGTPVVYTFLSPAPLEYRWRRGATGLHRGGLIGWASAAVLWALERACLKRAARIRVLSDFSARQLRSLYRISGDRIVRIPGGVDTAHFRPLADRAIARASLGLPAGRPLLFTVRNLEPRMGLDNLIRAVDVVRHRWPQTLLLIGGAGSLREPLERLTATLGLAAHVRFLGFVPDADLPRYYGVADAFVLPTRALEGFGLVTIEALACGTPVLGTAVGATPEILHPLAPSLVLRAPTKEAIADGLIRFLDDLARDPDGAQRLRAASRAHAETYDWERAVDAVEDTLQDLAAPPGLPGIIGDRQERARPR